MSFGLIEKAGEAFFSAQLTIDANGRVADRFRRVSAGGKAAYAGAWYCEGDQFHPFLLEGKRVVIGLCGDLRFEDNIEQIRELNPDAVWWPVYTDYTFAAWNTSIKYEYAEQAARIGKPVLYVNSYCSEKKDEGEAAEGEACYFSNGRIVDEAASGSEQILFVEI